MSRCNREGGKADRLPSRHSRPDPPGSDRPLLRARPRGSQRRGALRARGGLARDLRRPLHRPRGLLLRRLLRRVRSLSADDPGRPRGRRLLARPPTGNGLRAVPVSGRGRAGHPPDRDRGPARRGSLHPLDRRGHRGADRPARRRPQRAGGATRRSPARPPSRLPAASSTSSTWRSAAASRPMRPMSCPRRCTRPSCPTSASRRRRPS